MILGLSLILALIVLLRRAGTLAASAIGGIICLVVTAQTVSCFDLAIRSGCAPLIAMLVLTLGATRVGKAAKTKAGMVEDPYGRNAAQVIANLAMAALCFPLLQLVERFSGAGFHYDDLTVATAMMLAALAEAAADTVSSEIGQAFGGRPFLITTMRRVAAGTDGAVSLLGTGAGIIAAGIVALVGFWAFGGRPSLSAHPAAWIAFAGGVSGLLFDTVLGATIERRGRLGNDLVNFSSTVFSVGIALVLAMLL